MTEIEKCERHGEVPVWIVCKHVGAGSADSIIFSEKNDALCFGCASDAENLTVLDLVAMCEECLKDFTAKLMIDSKTLDNLKNRVKGIEYLKGKRSYLADETIEVER